HLACDATAVSRSRLTPLLTKPGHPYPLSFPRRRESRGFSRKHQKEVGQLTTAIAQIVDVGCIAKVTGFPHSRE
ncbi:hypothetical protein, partial [Lysobacter capsici]|uniref:hypothetical protein n=1 Tax=Lysobacter capsici TaxID=435897 RepID=UPI00398D03F5